MRRPCPDGKHRPEVVVVAEESPCGFCPVTACSACGCELRRECSCAPFAMVRQIEIERFPLQAVDVPAGAVILGVYETLLKGRLFLLYEQESLVDPAPLTLRMVSPGEDRPGDGVLPDPRRHRFLGIVGHADGLPTAVYYDAVAWKRIAAERAAAPGVDPEPMKA